ncbi:MAG: right-handed parallel beta-helix repeat-containing protein [Chitinispirillales bacterium]|jgi:hypothetical protein|nr:right-handed parallel beta-helix repeat-containing protein [Chitinispirillales bacterium]
MRIKINLLLTLLPALFSAAYSQTTVSGIIDRDTRWNAENGPFIIEGDILVTRRANLVIAPGTEIIIADSEKNESPAKPFDKADSALISIRVQGALTVVGKRDKPVTFKPQTAGLASYGWRGIIIDEAKNGYVEIAFAEISGATTGITVKKTNALLRNNIIENCNIGIHCFFGGTSNIYNNLITSCFTSAIKIERSNPQILNNIIAFNKNTGLWCDNTSKVRFRYNCVFGNIDGNFLDCDPETGRLSKVNKNNDSTDAADNIIKDPVFIGSAAQARAIALDVNTPTDSSKVKNPALLKILNIVNPQTASSGEDEPQTIKGVKNHYKLSKYSPCFNAGDPAKRFNNSDGKRNTIGPEGGPEFMGD